MARGQSRGIGRGAGVPGGIAPNRQTKFVTRKLLVTDTSGTLGSFVNTLSSSPQIADYNLIAGIGFFCAALVAGQVPGANAQEYRHGTHAVAIQNAEGLKTTIFQAQVTPPATATAVPPFISVQQQVYEDVRQTALTAPSILGSTPTVRPAFTAGSQLVDLTLQPALFKPLIIGQGAVPARTVAPPQSDPTQIGGQVFEPFTQPAIASNPIAAFFATLPQDENRQYSAIWKSQTVGQTPPVIPFIRSVSQDDTSQIAAQVIKASQSAPAVLAQWVPPLVIGLQQIYSNILPAAIMPSLVAGSLPGANAQEYRWGSHAQATHEAERAKTKVFPSAVSPPIVISAVPPFTQASPQNENRQYSVVWKSQTVGQTPRVLPFVKGYPQADPTQIGGQVFKAQPAVVTRIAAFLATLPQNENRQYSAIWKSQTVGQTPPVMPFVKGYPQADPTQIDGQVFKPYTPIPIPVAVFFATLPQNENRQYSVVWKSQVAGDKSRAAPFILGSPQIDPTQIAAQLVRSSLAQVVEWVVVDDAQSGSWTPVVDTQSGSWIPVVDTQSGSWTPVVNVQTGSWTLVYDAQTANWVLVDDSQ